MYSSGGTATDGADHDENSRWPVIVDFDLGPSEPDGAACVAALRHAGLVRPCAFLTSTPEEDVRRRLVAENVTDGIPLWPKLDGISAAVRWLTAIAMSGATG